MPSHGRPHGLLRFIGASPQTLKQPEWEKLHNLLEKEPHDLLKKKKFQELKESIFHGIKSNNREIVLDMIQEMEKLLKNNDE